MKAQLMPIIDSRKSFYDKAIIIKDNNESIKLQSYETIVAEIWPERNFELKVYNCQSQTTIRHINEFIYQYAPFKSKMNKKQMQAILTKKEN
jgi:hypothetical protein